MRQETKMLCLVAVLSLMPPAVHAQPEGAARWAPTGALIEGRQHHTATLLSSGQVLVAGGKREDLILPNAELYDPMTGEWTPTGSLKVARDRHTATLLPDGRVLVTGGEAFNEDYGFNLATAAVEIYDPATGRWSMANDLEITRAEHTATLLDSGKVLIVGGLSVEELVSASAELYDVAIGVSEAAGSFSERRWGHTATLLPSGKVLVVGGNRGVSVASAALYDPRTREWSPAGELALARTYHSATLLPDGKVLVAGGNQSSAVDGMLVTTFPTPAELYDPEEGTWTTTGSLHFARARHSAVLLPSGKVLAAGGQSGDFPWRETELYDPRTGEWTLDAPLAVNRRLHTSTLLPSGQVLAIGGEGVIENGLTSAEVYTPRSGVWSQTAAFPEPIAAHTATLLPSGDVLVAGGGEVRGSVDATPIALESLFNLIVPGDAAGLYRAGTSTWQPLARLGEARTGHSATLLPSGDVLVAAGLGKERFLASAEIFRSAEETWVPAAPLRTRRAAHTATLLASGEVVVAGGVNEEALAPETLTRALASADRYDPTRDHWTRTGDMLLARLGHTATLLPSGKVLVSGGWSENQYALESEVYDPSSGVWTETGRLNAGRLFHTATLLPSGKVLVAGGLPATNVELFDPESGTWTDLGDLDRTRTSNTATLLADGRLMVTGGTAIVDEITLSTLDAVDVYDPAPRAWRKEPRLTTPRALHTATVLADGGVLVVGGGQASTTLASAEIYRPEVDPTRRRPLILHHSPQVRHGRNLTVTGTGLRGDSAASQGNARDSAVDLPLVQLRSLEDERLFWLAPARGAWPDFSGETATLRVRELPADLQPGWHALTVYAAGLPSETRFVEVGCGLAVDAPPRDATAAIGATATFTVRTRGARSLQWQKDGFDIPGATAASYTTPPITAADAGASYRVRLANGCTTRTSPSAKLLVEDHEPPAAGVLYPRGGEIWLLSTPEQPNVQVVSWEMSDNVRICQVTASLVFSNDGGDTWESGPSVTYGPGGACAHPGEGRTSVTYPVPGVPPSDALGAPGSARKHSGAPEQARTS
ncbi:MAG TPA: kelch repeat-containing protein [Thermoanaerobaculia bacterium]|jgi:N-acetylneuraminic acid mutarotase